jgi:hypothetical protein
LIGLKLIQPGGTNSVDTFYLGRSYSLKSGKILKERTLYDPADLTTHGVVVGMTGSGKTGLCIDLLEEAALQGIPALLVDPKGDITNHLLHFPELAPTDFEPWVNPDQARREKTTVEALAEDTAKRWKDGLAKWEIDGERVRAVSEAVEYAIFTPGSDAGIPVSILASLAAPDLDWNKDEEILREKIVSTVTALLGLVGIEADPVRSREHILLANLFENAWRAEKDVTLEELIRLVQTPPESMKKLGAFEINQFFPQEDRFELAMLINNLLAAPSFQSWLEGAPLDVEALLFDGNKPRHSVFYLSHLPDNERMFFVTLLMAAVETWIRVQSGSTSLRALVYFDEVYGYLPPVANPPSKPPMLRLLKQARAFGLGMLLVTQNPVDLDYKALSNAGSWFVGKLQTEQDKARLLDGLESVEAGETGFKRSDMDKIISDLDKRVFLLHNVHAGEPEIFHTRWAMAYLRGPITRDRLAELNQFVGAKIGTVETGTATEAKTARSGEPTKMKESTSTVAQTRPAVPAGVTELFLPNNQTLSQALKAAGLEGASPSEQALIYRPSLLAQAMVRYLDRKNNIDESRTVSALVSEADRQGIIRWEDWMGPSVDRDVLDDSPISEAQFAELVPPFTDGKRVKSMVKDFLDYVYHDAGLTVLKNETLKLFAQPDTTRAEFLTQCSEVAREMRDEEIDKLQDKYEKKIDTLEDRLAREERELAEDEAELSGRKMEELATHAENVLGLFSGSRSSRRVSSSLSKRRMTSKAKADVAESMDEIEALRAELNEMAAELKDEIAEIEERWSEVASQIVESTITAYKKDIREDLFGLAWVPYWRVKIASQEQELPAYQVT